MINYVAVHPETKHDDEIMCCQAAHVIEDDDSIVESTADEYDASYPPIGIDGVLASTPKQSNSL
jgi:hypothetical protein